MTSWILGMAGAHGAWVYFVDADARGVLVVWTACLAIFLQAVSSAPLLRD